MPDAGPKERQVASLRIMRALRRAGHVCAPKEPTIKKLRGQIAAASKAAKKRKRRSKR